MLVLQVSRLQKLNTLELHTLQSKLHQNHIIIEYYSTCLQQMRACHVTWQVRGYKLSRQQVMDDVSSRLRLGGWLWCITLRFCSNRALTHHGSPRSGRLQRFQFYRLLWPCFQKTRFWKSLKLNFQLNLNVCRKKHSSKMQYALYNIRTIGIAIFSIPCKNYLQFTLSFHSKITFILKKFPQD